MNTADNYGKDNERKILISGGGIAGLTLGILLKEKGWNPIVIERDPSFRTSGYMMDFFGTGWDVAGRMGLLDDIGNIRYPINSLEYVDEKGKPRFSPVPLDRVRRAFSGKYTYLRRPDLERILFDHALSAGVQVHFGTTIDAVRESGSGVEVAFSDGSRDTFSLLFGADGVHSRVRELVFGPATAYERFLGYYIAGFDLDTSGYGIGKSVKIYEEAGRVAGFYPVNGSRMEAMYIFRHENVGHLPHERRVPFVREQFRGAGWIAERVLQEFSASEPIYFDSMTQILMPDWQKGRIALLGDACGCLTPLAGQGSHMAMAGAYVLAQELDKYRGDYRAAFPAYEHFLRPIVTRKQDEAMRFANRFVPSSRNSLIFRYLLMRLALSPLFIRYLLASFGAKSILDHYPAP
jgi:2-polyprenyl-6-methoxyphenol hydroxylase-like FAD-dependent oxidoreductase